MPDTVDVNARVNEIREWFSAPVEDWELEWAPGTLRTYRPGIASRMALTYLLNQDATLRARITELERVVKDLVDPNECRYDHHGYCQEHGWMEVDPSCPHRRAKAVLDAKEERSGPQS